MSVVVLVLLVVLNLLTVYFSWHSRVLDARVGECELACRRLAWQNQALRKELELAAGLRDLPPGLPFDHE